MIGYLRGNVVVSKRNEVWVDVSGVGYRVKIAHMEMRTDVGAQVELFIHTAVREDAITLYGFLTLAELDLFELLIEVSGIGPKTAMEIVGGAKSEDVEKAIREADVSFFAKIKGIGKKSAQRIIIDLKHKIGSLKEVNLSSEDEDDAVFMALKQFGFRSGDIQAVLGQIDRSLPEQMQVKEGLKLLGKVRH